MRVLFELPCGRSGRIAGGYTRAFRHAGHEVYEWDPGTEPAFDVFGVARPDLLVKSRGGPSTAIEKCIAARPRLRVADCSGGLRPGFDHLAYSPGTPRDSLKCDVAYVGEYRQEKVGLLDRYVLPLCERFRVKIFGGGPWPVPQHMGVISEALVPDLVASTKICLGLSKQGLGHWSYTVMGLGGRLVTSPDGSFPNDLCDHIGRVCSPNEAVEAVGFWLENCSVREMFRPGVAGAVAEAHTYTHRVSDLLRSVGFEREAARALEAFK